MLVAAGALFVFGGIGVNVGLALFAVLVLVAGAALLWRPNETPILLFILCFQWLQASISIFHANWKGVAVSHLLMAGESEMAIVLCLIGLLALACGMRLGAGGWRPQDGELARSIASSHSIFSWFRLWVLASIAALIAQTAGLAIPGLSQPLLILANLKWAFFWMLAYATFVRPGGGGHYFLWAFLFELTLGVGGYFSDFKTVMLFTVFAIVAAGVRLAPQSLLGLGGLSVLLVTFAIGWTAIKNDYRAFVSRGERAQIVTVDYGDRMAKLVDLVVALDGTAIEAAADNFLRRLTYVEFFGATLTMVPRSLPHEGGAIWWDAVSRPFMPRILFPDKAVIDDSARTNIYTGVTVAGADLGTSISIGYMGESYIDFGEIGMMVPLFLLGYFYGRLYRAMLVAKATRGPLGMAFATAILYGGAQLESSITKVFGGLVLAALVSWLIAVFLAPKYFRWVRADANG